MSRRCIIPSFESLAARPASRWAAAKRIGPLSDIPKYDRGMRTDDIAARIEAFNDANGGGVGLYEHEGAYHLYLLETEAPIARLPPAR